MTEPLVNGYRRPPLRSGPAGDKRFLTWRVRAIGTGNIVGRPAGGFDPLRGIEQGTSFRLVDAVDFSYDSESSWYQIREITDDVGKPFNIASYALLTLMVADVTGLKPGDFVHTLGDAHLYSNHFEQAREQLRRTPRALPTMWINPEVKDLFAFRFEDFRLENYVADASIKAPIAV